MVIHIIGYILMLFVKLRLSGFRLSLLHLHVGGNLAVTSVLVKTAILPLKIVFPFADRFVNQTKGPLIHYIEISMKWKRIWGFIKFNNVDE